ncbi:MAG: hypothetical protein EOP21_07250 [Hyphomicrobiales bacterium]|nr:MAG: hypothetical protein EOP21_07250 [Hyphomicrobiales bacterium]
MDFADCPAISVNIASSERACAMSIAFISAVGSAGPAPASKGDMSGLFMSFIAAFPCGARSGRRGGAMTKDLSTAYVALSSGVEAVTGSRKGEKMQEQIENILLASVAETGLAESVELGRWRV